MQWGLISLMMVKASFPEGRDNLKAGKARVSITPMEEKIPTQLGGYGARKGKPAEGIHDTLYAKILLLEWEQERFALITVDACSVPIGLTREIVKHSGVKGLMDEHVMLAASHGHAGLEGFALDRRNVFDNPHIGIFSEAMLDFVVHRISRGLQEAEKVLQPVRAASGVVRLPNMNRNRRGDAFVDPDMTVLRLDTLSGCPYVVLVNYTAHGTIMTEHEMLISGGWQGNMQRTVEALMGSDVTCMYTNGAEGDISPVGAQGRSRWEMAGDYGLRTGIIAARLAETLTSVPVSCFSWGCEWCKLPDKKAAPDFLKIAGDEYHITAEQIGGLLNTLFPQQAPLYMMRINDFAMITFPGEPVCQLGLALKKEMREAGLTFPCVASVTSEYIGYILTPEGYRKSGYEVTASFYGESLGPVLMDTANYLIHCILQ